MSPDLDYKVDRRDKFEELPMTLAQIEKANHKIAKEELQKVILAQKITLDKNT